MSPFQTNERAWNYLIQSASNYMVYIHMYLKNFAMDFYVYIHVCTIWGDIGLALPDYSFAHFSKLWTLITSKQITLRSCPWYKWKSFSRAFQWCITSVKNRQSQNRQKRRTKKKKNKVDRVQSPSPNSLGWNNNYLLLVNS